MIKPLDNAELDERCVNCLARIVGHACPGVSPGEDCLNGDGPVYTDPSVSATSGDTAKSPLINPEGLPDPIIQTLSYDEISILGHWLFKQLAIQRNADHEYYTSKKP